MGRGAQRAPQSRRRRVAREAEARQPDQHPPGVRTELRGRGSPRGRRDGAGGALGSSGAIGGSGPDALWQRAEAALEGGRWGEKLRAPPLRAPRLRTNLIQVLGNSKLNPPLLHVAVMYVTGLEALFS